MLCQGSTVAVDRHLTKFIEDAGLGTRGYVNARDLLNATALEMGIDPSALDYSIWLYMSTKPK